MKFYGAGIFVPISPAAIAAAIFVLLIPWIRNNGIKQRYLQGQPAPASACFRNGNLNRGARVINYRGFFILLSGVDRNIYVGIIKYDYGGRK